MAVAIQKSQSLFTQLPIMLAIAVAFGFGLGWFIWKRRRFSITKNEMKRHRNTLSEYNKLQGRHAFAEFTYQRLVTEHAELLARIDRLETNSIELSPTKEPTPGEKPNCSRPNRLSTL